MPQQPTLQVGSRKRARSPTLDEKCRRRLRDHLAVELGDTLPMHAYLAVMDGSYDGVPMEVRRKMALACERLAADLQALASECG
jgi:hypothetical protein